MERKNIQYKDLQCVLIEENSKKYLVIEELQESMKSKAKEYGFVKQDNVWKLEVYNCYSDYNLDEGTLYSSSVGRFILSDSEIIYAFQMDGCGFSSRYWQITYEEYINYKIWKEDEHFIRKIVDERPYLDTYFSHNDLFKIVKQWEKDKDKEYYLQDAQKPTEIVRLIIREKEDKLIFIQLLCINLAEIDIEELNDIFSDHLYYNGYISSHEWDRECWNDTLYFRDSEKVIACRKLKDSGENREERLKEERDALKSIILEIDKRDLIDATNKAIAIAQEYINDNIYTEFMNTLIKNYTLAKDELEIVTGACRAYSYSCPYIGDNREKELLKTMDKAEQIYQRLLDNRKKYNIQQNADEKQHINKDDFLNSYYNKD